MLNALQGLGWQGAGESAHAAGVMEQQIVETAMTAKARISFPNGVAYCGSVVQIVPWGKSLIVDSVRFHGISSDGQGFLKVATITGGQPMCYIVPAIRNHPSLGFAGVLGMAEIDLPADQGTAVVVSYYRGYHASNVGVTEILVKLNGRYADL